MLSSRARRFLRLHLRTPLLGRVGFQHLNWGAPWPPLCSPISQSLFPWPCAVSSCWESSPTPQAHPALHTCILGCLPHPQLHLASGSVLPSSLGSVSLLDLISSPTTSAPPGKTCLKFLENPRCQESRLRPVEARRLQESH